MKILPCEMGGILITPENLWEESYLSSLYENLHIKELRFTNFPQEKFQSLILIEKEKGDIIYK